MNKGDVHHITLHPHQRTAVGALLESLATGHRPVASLPPGSGKSYIAAALCAALPGRTLVLSHRKELLEQDRLALSRYAPDVSSGIYSAGLGLRDTMQRVIFGGVASVYRRLDELQQAGAFATVIIDEAHLVPSQGGDGVMYNSCLSSLPNAALAGLTATPYRMDSGLLHEGEGARFDDLCIHIPPSSLVQDGFLSPLVGIGARQQLDTDGVRVRLGEHVSSELSQVACTGDRVERTVQELLLRSAGRRSGIVFAIDVGHAEIVTSALERHDGTGPVALVTGMTPARARDGMVRAFRAGETRWLVNVGVLTTGFDAPATDCIALLRPTLSKGLYVQMLGRGLRTAPGKENCLVLDFGGNIMRHGSLDMLQSERHERTEKQEREERAGSRGARERQRLHAVKAFGGDPMTGTVAGMEEVVVRDIRFHAIPARRSPDKTNLVATYNCDGVTIRQWICVEYSGGARWHAEQWFRRRGLDAPRNARSALGLARKAAKPESLSIYYEEAAGQMWPRIAIEHFPETGAPSITDGNSESETA